MNLLYLIVCIVGFIAMQSILINYKVEKLNKNLLITLDDNVRNEYLLNTIIKNLSKTSTESRYDNETQFRDLKAEILHNSAELYRLREQINQLKAKEESAPGSAAPPSSSKRNVKPRVVLLEEATTRTPPPKAEPKTSDKPT